MEGQIATAIGYEQNRFDGFYRRGRAYDEVKKLEVAELYLQRSNNRTIRPNLSDIARACKVDPSFVRKIEGEIFQHGRVLTLDEGRANRDIVRGPGVLTLSNLDQCTLLRLYYDQPWRTLGSYQLWLEYYTGTFVSRDTISRFFRHGFPHKGSLVKPNLVPWDKFKPENEIRAYEYLEILINLNPKKVVFGDEKSLKGAELFSKLVRVNPLTGDVPACPTDPDFRNTYTVTGFCSVNQEKLAPVWFDISKQTNNTETFTQTVMRAISHGYFDAHDVIVVDNATYHKDLEELLWNTCRAAVLRLPARSPEWNPKELVWNTLVQRMKYYNIEMLREFRGRHVVAHVGKELLQEITFEEVQSFYEKCYEFLPTFIGRLN